MHAAVGSQDHFFRVVMITLPVFSLCAYIFDTFFYYRALIHSEKPAYEGLLSTILIVFSYLQYCAPIQSRRILACYHVLLWILVEAGHVGYLLTFAYSGNTFTVIIYVGWIILDTVFTISLIHCRVRREYPHRIVVTNRHIFHFISRLEIILAIFIPIFINPNFTTLTRDNIAFFLLFDFFSETYERFRTRWIKSCLYLFVIAVTISVTCEWLYFRFQGHTLEYIVDVSELTAASLCDILIIMQFYEYHCHPNPDAPAPVDNQRAAIQSGNTEDGNVDIIMYF